MIPVWPRTRPQVAFQLITPHPRYPESSCAYIDALPSEIAKAADIVIQVAQPIDHESGILLTRQSFASCEGNTHGFIYSAGAFSPMDAGARDTFLTRLQNSGNCIDSLDESHGFIGR